MQADWKRITKLLPEAGRRVVVWGGGYVRFGYRDEHGQWRGYHHRPMNGLPTFWDDLPQPPGSEATQ